MTRVFLVCAPLLALMGCLAVDCGYAPNVEVEERHVRLASEKVPVTFSVTLECPLLDTAAFAPTQNTLRARLQAALEATHLFSSVQYVPSAPQDAYHIAFAFHIGGATPESDASAGLIAGGSLGLIPVWTWATFDGSAQVSLRGKPLYAQGAAEKMWVPVWLPLAPIGLFWNCAVGWHYVEKGVVNALVNGASAFHKTRFLNK